MLQHMSKIEVTDNSGAKKAVIIKNLGGSFVKFSNIGDVVVCSIKKALPTSLIKPGDIVRAIIVRTNYGIKRKDGSHIKFDDNAVVIINEKKQPKATRIFGPVARELRELGYAKIISLAPEVL